MAKAKVKAKPETEAKPKSQLGSEEVRKIFGDGVIVPGSSILSYKPEIVSLSPRLDAALGGGIQVGTLVTLTGPAGCGKTTTALRAAANWQKLGRTVYYFATEWRLNPRDLESVAQLDPKKLKVIRSYEKEDGTMVILSGQDYIQIADKILRNERYVMIIMDSFSMIGEADDMASDDYKQGAPAVMNRMISTFCKRMAPVLPLNHNILIGTFHTYANIGGMTALKGSVPGKVEFARSTGLFCRYVTIEKEKTKVKDEEVGIGQTVHWTVERSMLEGGMTGTKASSRITYGKGIDASQELFDLATSISLIVKGGAWYTLEYLGDRAVKFQGSDKVIEYLDQNPKDADLLYDLIKERMF